MPYLIKLKQFKDERGVLTIAEQEIPFTVKRIFYIQGKPGYSRGGHRHHKTTQALICINESCIIYNNNGKKEEEFVLDHPSKCLILEPKDWHIMHKFKPGAILLVLASTLYDKNDYIDVRY